ncbi:MAG TPA: diguanylate cyclase [Terracidiphilus sp.]|nr:diguanylate cyclase [Terracidiphilus sp.]
MTVAALVAALAYVGLASGRGAGHVPAIWWANSALASAMLLDRRRRWMQLLAAGYVGNVFGHLVFHDPLWEVFTLSAIDTIETAIAAFGVGYALGRRVDLTRQPQLLRFVGFAVLLAPLVASVLASIALHLVTKSPLTVSVRWFPASALGMAIVVPVILGLARQETRELFAPGHLGNTLLYLLMIAAATTAIFTGADFPWLFLIFPPLLFLVVRLGLSGGMLGCCVVAAIGTHFTVAVKGGPFSQLLDPSLENRILLLQLFLATAVLSVSVVAIVLADLKRANAAAGASEAKYRDLASSMEALATVDPLTGAANRRQFDRVIQAEWQRAHRLRAPLTLLLLDVDRFKAFNDLYGHLEGDNCLSSIARIALETTRRSSDTVARLGGEEFAVILPGTPEQGAVEMAERLRKAVLDMKTTHQGNSHGVVTVSVGCATVVPRDGESSTEMMAAADAALYAAKAAGRNCVKAGTEGLGNRE